MEGRFAARKLKYFRLALGRNVSVEHEVHLFHRELESGLGEMRAGVGEAERAVEIASGIDLDQSQACVLPVLGAESAVVRAALANLGRECDGQGARLVVAGDLRVQLRVPKDEGLEPAVLGTAFAHDHPTIPKEDLGIDDTPAIRAKAASQLPKNLRSVDFHRMPL